MLLDWATKLVPMPYRILGMVILIVGLYLYAHHEGAVEQYNADIADNAKAVAVQLKDARKLHDTDAAASKKSELDKQAVRNQLAQTKGERDAILQQYNEILRNPQCDLPPLIMCIFNGGDPKACEGQTRGGHDSVPGSPQEVGPKLGGRGGLFRGGSLACISRLPTQAKSPL